MSDPKNVWQNLETKGKKMSSQEIRAKAEKMATEIRRDTIIGFVLVSSLCLTGLIALAFLPQAGTPERIIVTIIVALLCVGAYRTSMRPRLAPGAQFTTCLEFYRSELERRRSYFSKPWILLFVMLLALAQFFFVMQGFKGAALWDMLAYPGALLLLAAIVVPLWRWQARRFQRELDALNDFEREE